VRGGRLKALAVTSDVNLPGMEGIPLAKDIAPGLVAKGWFTIFAPKGRQCQCWIASTLPSTSR
jgi:tripartite-type tricarboxylate transporter receptor subunit TctC